MSYILDALRRADAERERGSVPSLHAQSVQTMGAEDEPRPKGKPMVWVVAGLSLALAASIAWQFMGRESPREPAEGKVAPLPMNAQTAPAAAPQAPTPVRPTVTPPDAVAPAQSAHAQLPPVPASPRVLAPVPAPTPPAAAVKTQATTTGALPPPPAASANIRIPTQEQLPDDIRRQLPKLVVGGSIYSESAASRFLILNGQIFHENDKVMPELVLEQIKLKAAVLRYKNQRFSISY